MILSMACTSTPSIQSSFIIFMLVKIASTRAKKSCWSFAILSVISMMRWVSTLNNSILKSAKEGRKTLVKRVTKPVKTVTKLVREVTELCRGVTKLCVGAGNLISHSDSGESRNLPILQKALVILAEVRTSPVTFGRIILFGPISQNPPQPSSPLAPRTGIVNIQFLYRRLSSYVREGEKL